MKPSLAEIDADTLNAAQLFIARTAEQYDVVSAVLYGSRARRTHGPDSDADIAIVLGGIRTKRFDVAVNMAGIAFDVLLETGVLVGPLPLWENEWKYPEQFNNPALIENIQREGVFLSVTTPTVEVKTFVQSLAAVHNVTFVKTVADNFAETVTRLAGDEVVTDEVEDLIVALKRARIIDAATMVEILGKYLDEKKLQSITNKSTS